MGSVPGNAILNSFLTLKETQWYWIYCGVDYLNNNIYISYSSKENYFEHTILNISISNIVKISSLNDNYLMVAGNLNEGVDQNFDLRCFKYYHNAVYRTVPEVLKLLTKEICILNYFFLYFKFNIEI